jgi:predicted GNAT family acetyltransferase
MSETIDNKIKQRYELAVDDHTALSYYTVAGGVLTFMHTEVPAELGGKGVGSKLIAGALDLARADGLKVVALCPFVRAFLDKHAEAYKDLRK